MKKLNKKGFTLTELIVVIAVIAILAAVLIPTLTGYIEKARVSADNQEVAVLNKLLLGAQIDEVEFKDVNELKKYLAEEMEYDGDYTLGVKDSYLWYDTESYEFVIKSKSDVEKLDLAAKTYTYATTLKSPEGLLVDNNGNEVWLVGGKGEWVEAVEAIRNLGNNSSSEIQDVLDKALEDLGLKDKAADLLKDLAFVGSEGKAYEYKDNQIQEIVGPTNKNIIFSNTVTSVTDNLALFHNLYITQVINYANDHEKFSPLATLVASEQNANGSYDIIVNLKKVNDNTIDELGIILSFITELVKYFYEVNYNDYNSSSLFIETKPIVADELIIAEKINDDALELAELFTPGITKEDLINNINNGITITSADDQKLYELLSTVLGAALINQEVSLNGGYNLSLIANESIDNLNASNKVAVSATFGETVITYNFVFISAQAE